MSALALEHPQLPTSSAYLPAQEKFNQLLTQLRASQTQQMTHSQLETLIETEGREVLRRLLQGHLDERAPGISSTPVVDALDHTHSHQRTHTRQLETLFGTVSITRTGYGGRGLESLHPLDGALNLPEERYSHTLRRRAALAAAQTSFDEVVSCLEQTSGAHVAKRQVEQLVARAAQEFDTFYENQREATAKEVRTSGCILVLSFDGKGVPMKRADLRKVTRQAAEGRQHKLVHRRSRGEKTATKRMGTVAAVYTTAPFVRTPDQIVAELRTEQTTPPDKPPRPEDKRVWASVEHSPQTIIRQAFDEAVRRDPKGRKRWCVLVDGSRYQLKILRLVARDYCVKLRIVLDLIHVCQYLWSAAWAFYREGDPKAEAWVRKRLLEILRGRSSVVAAGLRRSATLRRLSKKERRPVDRCANYLLKNREYLHYDEYLKAGMPIATGVIEGACRHLVKDRMELTGARWSLQGAEAVLRLRSLRSSGDFDEYWEFHLQQEYQRQHAMRYAEGKVPVPEMVKAAGKATHLRLVK